MALAASDAKTCTEIGRMLCMAAGCGRSIAAGVVAGSAGCLAGTDPNRGGNGSAVTRPIPMAVGTAGGIIIPSLDDSCTGPCRPDIGAAEELCAVKCATLYTLV